MLLRFCPHVVFYLPYLLSRNMGGELLSDLHSGETHCCDFIHSSPLSAFIFMISPPVPSPQPLPMAAKAYFQPWTKQSRDDRQHGGRWPHEDPQPDVLLPVCFEARHERPFQRDAENCHQSLSSPDNDPARTKRKGKITKHIDVLFIIIHGLRCIYNHESHSSTKTATVFVLVLILCTI